MFKKLILSLFVSTAILTFSNNLILNSNQQPTINLNQPNSGTSYQFNINKQLSEKSRLTGSLVDNQGNIWIASVDKGLWVKYSGSKVYVQVKGLDNKTNHDVRNIIQDKTGNIWITAGDSQGSQNLYKSSNYGKTFSLITNSSWNNYGINNIYCDNQNNIWVGEATDVIPSLWKSTDGINFTASFKPSNKIVSVSLFEDNQNTYWLGTAGNNLYKSTDSGITWLPVVVFTQDPTQQILSMYQDNNNNIWACTFNGGLWESSDYGNNWKLKLDKSKANTMAITQDKNNDFWMTSQGSYIWFSKDQGTTWTQFKFNKSTKPNPPESWMSNISFDINNNMILATGGGLYIGSITYPNTFIPSSKVPTPANTKSVAILIASIIGCFVLIGLVVFYVISRLKGRKNG